MTLLLTSAQITKVNEALYRHREARDWEGDRVATSQLVEDILTVVLPGVEIVSTGQVNDTSGR